MEIKPDFEYQSEIIKHYSTAWKSEPRVCLWDKGPLEKLPSDFRILEFCPNHTRNMWTYATCCMSQVGDENPIEIHVFSSVQDEGIIELLTATAYYHRNTKTIGLNHTINFGKSWQNKSICDHGFISLPFLDGPILETLNIFEKAIKFYWVIPITESEVLYKKKFGAEALEEKFDNGIKYLDPLRGNMV